MQSVTQHTYLRIPQSRSRVLEAVFRYTNTKPFGFSQGKYTHAHSMEFSHTHRHPTSQKVQTVDSIVDTQEFSSEATPDSDSSASADQLSLKKNEAHRHIVAFPLFALGILAVMFLGKATTTLASVDATPYERVDAAKADHVITLPNSDTRVLVFRGAFFELWNARPILRDGSILAGSNGLTEIYADRVVVKGINGAFHVSMKNGVLTVAAITTPVSVRMGQQSVAVPTGYQWQSPAGDLAGRESGWQQWLADRKPVASPRKFVRDMAEKWAAIPSEDTSIEAGDSGAFWALPFKFSAAKERAFARWSEGILANLGVLTRSGDTASLEAMLKRSDVQELIAQDSSMSALGATLLGSTEVPAIRADVIPMLHDDSDAFMLSALHPALRSVAWTHAPDVNVKLDSDLLRLVMLPLTDTGEEPISEILLSQWEEEFRGAMDQLKDDKGAFLAAYMPVLAEVSRNFAETGYPERAQHYRNFILSLGETYHDQLSAETQMFLDALLHQDIADIKTPALQDTPEQPSAPVQKPEPIPPEVGEKLRSEAREKMRQAGAVFSTQTAFTPVSPTSVRVTDIIFATSTTDRNLTFVWDMSKDEIRDITTSGKILPFPLTFAQFQTWATGQDQ